MKAIKLIFMLTVFFGMSFAQETLGEGQIWPEFTTINVDTLRVWHQLDLTTYGIGIAVGDIDADSVHAGSALTTDSAATVNLASNLITIGAATTDDQDITLRFAESDDNHELKWNDGEGGWRFSGGHIRTTSSIYMGESRSSWCFGSTYGAFPVIYSNPITSTGLLINVNSTGAGTLNLGNAEADTTRIQSADIIDIDGYLLMGPTTYDSTATMGAGTMFILDTAAGQDTLNLPAVASHTGRMAHIVAVNANGGHIDGDEAETISGAAVVDLAQWACRKLFCDGTQWIVIGN